MATVAILFLLVSGENNQDLRRQRNGLFLNYKLNPLPQGFTLIQPIFFIAKLERKQKFGAALNNHPYLSSAILASGSGGFGGATSSSGASEAVSAGVLLFFETSCSRFIEGTSTGKLLRR